jgi:hypothetical protein
VASAGKAGNSSFSFAMEISGVVLKRSNFQLYFDDKDNKRTDLVEVRRRKFFIGERPALYFTPDG